MKKRRGFTLLEWVLAAALCGMLMAAATNVYRLIIQRSAFASSMGSVQVQSTLALDQISKDISQAVQCEIQSVSGTSVLVIRLPNAAVLNSADQQVDYYLPAQVSPQGALQYVSGPTVYYYAVSAGSGVLIARGSSPNGFVILSSNDTKFTTIDGTRNRFPSLTSFTFSVNPSQQVVTLNVLARTLMRSTSQAATADTSNETASASFTRVVEWRNAN